MRFSWPLHTICLALLLGIMALLNIYCPLCANIHVQISYCAFLLMCYYPHVHLSPCASFLMFKYPIAQISVGIFPMCISPLRRSPVTLIFMSRKFVPTKICYVKRAVFRYLEHYFREWLKAFSSIQQLSKYIEKYSYWSKHRLKGNLCQFLTKICLFLSRFQLALPSDL